jgi:hypothetical protein
MIKKSANNPKLIKKKMKNLNKNVIKIIKSLTNSTKIKMRLNPTSIPIKIAIKIHYLINNNLKKLWGPKTSNSNNFNNN